MAEFLPAEQVMASILNDPDPFAIDNYPLFCNHTLSTMNDCKEFPSEMKNSSGLGDIQLNPIVVTPSFPTVNLSFVSINNQSFQLPKNSSKPLPKKTKNTAKILLSLSKNPSKKKKTKRSRKQKTPDVCLKAVVEYLEDQLPRFPIEEQTDLMDLLVQAQFLYLNRDVKKR